MVERLEHGNGVDTRSQQGEQGVPGLRRPRVEPVVASWAHAVGGQSVEGTTGDRRARLRRGRCRGQHQHAIPARVDVG